METTLTIKGQVTIPKHIREQLRLEPGARVRFSVNAAGELIIQPAPLARKSAKSRDRFDAVRGGADVPWRTDDLMKLLREA